MITYEHWRHRYVKPYEKGLYVAYNIDGDFTPTDSVTVSEASGCFLLQILLAGFLVVHATGVTLLLGTVC